MSLSEEYNGEYTNARDCIYAENIQQIVVKRRVGNEYIAIAQPTIMALVSYKCPHCDEVDNRLMPVMYCQYKCKEYKARPKENIQKAGDKL